MDMVLYSLMKKQIEATPKDQVDNVDGYEIRFVTSAPSKTEDKTIYFVMGTGSDKDRIVIGKQGLKQIIADNAIIDFGVLNGNTFFNRFDDNRGIVRQLFDVTTQPIICSNSVEYDINLFNVKGNGASHLTSISLGDRVMIVDKELLGVYNGNSDEVDVVKHKYIKRVNSTIIDNKITWASSGTSGNYRIFRASSYSGGKPDILKTNGLFDDGKYLPIDKQNSMITSSTFVTTTSDDVNKECVYVSNNVLYLRIDSTKANSNSSLQTYLKNNPITIYLTMVDEVVEDLEPISLTAYNGTTEISLEYTGDCPRTVVEIPTK